MSSATIVGTHDRAGRPGDDRRRARAALRKGGRRIDRLRDAVIALNELPARARRRRGRRRTRSTARTCSRCSRHARGARRAAVPAARSARRTPAATAARLVAQAAQVADIVPEVYFSGPRSREAGGDPRQPAHARRAPARGREPDGDRHPGREGRPRARLPDGAGPAAARASSRRARGSRSSSGRRSRQAGRGARPGSRPSGRGAGGRSPDRGRRPDKAAAACVYLWARDRASATARPQRGRASTTRCTEGQIAPPRGRRSAPSTDACDHDAARSTQLARLTGDREVAFTALLERIVEQRVVNVVDASEIARPRSGRSSLLALRRQRARVQRRARAGRRDALDVARGADRRRAAPRADRSDAARPRARRAGDPGLLPLLPDDCSSARCASSRRRRGSAAAPRGSRSPRSRRRSVFALPHRRRADAARPRSGSSRVEPLGDALPLGAIPLDVARPAIAGGARSFARGEAFEQLDVGAAAGARSNRTSARGTTCRSRRRSTSSGLPAVPRAASRSGRAGSATRRGPCRLPSRGRAPRRPAGRTRPGRRRPRARRCRRRECRRPALAIGRDATARWSRA